MSPHEYSALHFLHVFGALLLIAYTFFAFASTSDGSRKKVMIATGIANLLILVSGIRMWQSLYGFAPLVWIIVKIVGWFGLAAFAGLAYRRREKAGLFAIIALALAALNVAMAYFQPGKL